jgi:PAS domain S-box-containing protein
LRDFVNFRGCIRYPDQDVAGVPQRKPFCWYSFRSRTPIRQGRSAIPTFNENSALRHILSGTAAETGNRFFEVLVTNLATVFGVDFAWVTEYLPDSRRLRALAFIQDGKLVLDFEYAISGTPCEPVIDGACLIHHPSGVQDCYPDDEDLKTLSMEGYLGIPLLATDGRILGHMAIMDRRPMPKQAEGLEVLRIFAMRAAAELQRLSEVSIIKEQEQEQARLSRELQAALQQLSDSETRYRDLFDEAPIAYVNEGLDSRFIAANKTALRILGIPADKAVGFLGRSLAPETTEAQGRVEEALGSINRGLDVEGVVLELRRFDNGDPVWVHWWSKPDLSGEFTRTMFIDITDVVLMAKEKDALQAQNDYLREEIDNIGSTELVARSRAMRQVLSDLKQVAATDASVLILGETGTGKEVVARALHKHSLRADRPLIKVNCGALPDALIESELFGHEKGAFTGATAKRDGRFKLADGGTIFLDEVGDLPLQLQVKLLRVLQEGEFEPLGSSASHKVDVRVVAATNRDLYQAVQDGEFREDLYYRLAVFPIELPPLRERLDDVAELVHVFSNEFAQRLGRRVEPVSETELEQLLAYGWPGNIRELHNVVERAIITSTDGRLNLKRALPETAGNTPAATSSVKTVAELEQLERENLLLALEQTRGRISGDNGAAKLLGMNPSTLNSRLKALKIRWSSDRA